MYKYIKKHLIVFAFFILILLILLGTLIINFYWGGSIFLAKSTKFDTIKDYMGIYISMLSFVSTIFASLVVIFAYDAWKEQKNYDSDSNLLNIAEDNLLKFNSEIDPICKKIIQIYQRYIIKNEYYIAHSLYKKPFDSDNQYLDEFSIQMERYINYNTDEPLRVLVEEYTRLSKDILSLNTEFLKEVYLPIYNDLKSDHNETWIDSISILGNFPLNDLRKQSLNNNFNQLKRFYLSAIYLEEKNESTGEFEENEKNYKQTYDLMKNYYTRINTMIKNKNRA